MTVLVRRVVAVCVLAGCSSTAGGVTQDEGGEAVPRADGGDAPIDAGTDASASDAGTSDAGARDAGARDAGARDAGARDAGPQVEGRCFEDVELVTLRGGRELLEPIGVFGYDGGWVVAYSASAHDGTGGRFATFLDRKGRVTATQTLGSEDVRFANAQLGPFVLSWLYDQSALHEIREGEIIARPDLADRLPPSRIVSVEEQSDRLRVLSATRIDPAAGNFRFAYSELVLDDGGELVLRSGALPAVETLGSPGLVAGLTAYHAPVSLVLSRDTFFFAFPTGEDPFNVDGQPWNVMRVALDRSALESGAVDWTLVDETRWEEGPSSVFGAFPELDLVVTGRFRPSDGSRYWPAITVESFLDPGAFRSIPLNTMEESSSAMLGPAGVVRRGEVVGVHTPGEFRVFSLPRFEPQAAASLELTNSIIHWSEDEVIEVGSVRSADGLVALARCHELRAP